jgi:feruloyl esterase
MLPRCPNRVEERNPVRPFPGWVRVGLSTVALVVGGFATQAYGATCESLLSLKLPSTLINSAQSIAAGTYQPPGSATAFTNLPAFCRVTATVSTVPDSSIGIEVWLPTATWNGKYQQSGNHGFGGTFYWTEMTRQLQRGYATGITDDGHSLGGFNVSWAFGHPQKIVDLAWRAVHELAEKSKLIISAFYGRPQRYAYMNACSDGGREAMKEAQMFPRDFDGIIAGGAAIWWTHAATEQLVMSINLQKAGIQGASGNAVLNLAQTAATAACDAQDGVVDGLINDPRRCHWDPTTLVCKAGQDPSTCFTPAQAAAIKANSETLRDPVTGQWIFSGQSVGSEFDQIRFGADAGLAPFGIANYQLALNDPNWNGSTFDLHTDLPILDRELGIINATDPDLAAFKRAGGKLIEWHEWDDFAFTPGATVKYYEQVVDETGHGKLENVQDFYRLFVLPGVGHCSSATTDIGPDNIGAENQTAASPDPQHDIVSALEAWVEKGTAPSQLIATQYNNPTDPTQGIKRQRPICPYPSEAVYKGSGSVNDASSFVCAAPASDEGEGSDKGEQGHD